MLGHKIREFKPLDAWWASDKIENALTQYRYSYLVHYTFEYSTRFEYNPRKGGASAIDLLLFQQPGPQ